MIEEYTKVVNAERKFLYKLVYDYFDLLDNIHQWCEKISFTHYPYIQWT